MTLLRIGMLCAVILVFHGVLGAIALETGKAVVSELGARNARAIHSMEVDQQPIK